MNQSGIQRVGMLILRQPDIAAAITFYQKLGLKLKFQLQEKWAEMALGDMKIGLCPTDTAHEYRTGIVLHVDDLVAFYTLHKDTVPFIGEPKEAVHGIMISFKDPGGNIIDLYQPTPEKVAQLVRTVASQGDQSNDNCCKKNKKMGSREQSQQCCKSGSYEALS